VESRPNDTPIRGLNQDSESFGPEYPEGPYEGGDRGSRCDPRLISPSVGRYSGVNRGQSPREGQRPALAVPSLDTTTTSDDAPRRECGRQLVIVCTNCGKEKKIREGCGDRFFCGWCRKRYLRDTEKRFGPLVDRMKGRLRFITLTVASGPDAFERLQHLEKSFRRLKQRKIWKLHVRGAIRSLEVTYNAATGWHPHYHILTDGAFIPQADLSAAWAEITGDSKIVDIREWKGGKAAAKKELFKYTVKDFEIPPRFTLTIQKLLRGKRLTVGLGKLYNREERPEPRKCSDCGAVAWFPMWRDLEELWRVDWQDSHAPPAERETDAVQHTLFHF